MTAPRIVVTIDGGAGSGKTATGEGVVGQINARGPFRDVPNLSQQNFTFISTGQFYRAAALAAILANPRKELKDITPQDAILALQANTPSLQNDLAGKCRIFLKGEDVTPLLASEKISLLTSQIAQDRQLRAYLIDLQRNAFSPAPCIAEGRDLGQVVFRDAVVKIFMCVKNPEIAARRRAAQLGLPESQIPVIKQNIIERNARDAKNMVLPPDAIEVDNSGDSTETIDKVYHLTVTGIKQALRRQ